MTSQAIKTERAKAREAKSAQLQLFSNYQRKLKNSSALSEKVTIQKLKNERQKLLEIIKAKEREFRKTHLRPLAWKRRFNASRYKRAITNYESEKYLFIAHDYEKYEGVTSKIRALEAQLLKKLIKKNEAARKNALLIIDNEYQKRVEAIFTNQVEKSFIGRWRRDYALRKHKARTFEGKYHLLKLTFKRSLRKASGKKYKRQLKSEFENSVKKLKSETQKLVIKI